MKKIILAMLLFYQTTVYGVVLRVCYENTEQFPYYMGHSNAIPEKPGVSSDLVNKVAEKLDIQTQFSRIPWKRCLAWLKTGAMDAAFNASFKKARMEMGRYPMQGEDVDPNRRLTTLSYALYVLNGSNLKWDGKQFLNLKGKLSAPLGYSIIDKLKSNGAEVETSVDTIAAFNKLVSRKVAGVAAQTVTGEQLKVKFPIKYQHIVASKPYLVTKPYYMMLSHQFYERNPAFAEKIWDVLAEQREQHLQSLLESYY